MSSLSCQNELDQCYQKQQPALIDDFITDTWINDDYLLLPSRQFNTNNNDTNH